MRTKEEVLKNVHLVRMIDEIDEIYRGELMVFLMLDEWCTCDDNGNMVLDWEITPKMDRGFLIGEFLSELGMFNFCKKAGMSKPELIPRTKIATIKKEKDSYGVWFGEEDLPSYDGMAWCLYSDHESWITSPVVQYFSNERGLNACIEWCNKRKVRYEVVAASGSN